MRPERTVQVAIGAVAGVLSALFGVGGGIMIVPALVARGVPVKRAAATSLAAIGITGSVGATRYGFSGHVVWRDALLIGLPAVAGVLLGTALQKRISGPRLQIGFAVVMVLVALRLLTTSGTPTGSGGAAVAIALGLVGGVLAGLFGVGGGIVFVPALTLGLGLAQLTAEATSLAAMVPVVCVGALRQHRTGLVDWRTGAVIGVASTAGVLVGVEIATSLSNDALRRGFAVLLVITAAQLAQRGRAQLRAAAT